AKALWPSLRVFATRQSRLSGRRRQRDARRGLAARQEAARNEHLLATQDQVEDLILARGERNRQHLDRLAFPVLPGENFLSPGKLAGGPELAIGQAERLGQRGEEDSSLGFHLEQAVARHEDRLHLPRNGRAIRADDGDDLAGPDGVDRPGPFGGQDRRARRE